MSVGRSLRILLALLLLSAQHAAFAHQIWHLGDKSSQPAQQRLCDQHGALGSVAGALDCAMAQLPGEAPADFSFRFVNLPAAALPGLAPSSRGPPSFL